MGVEEVERGQVGYGLSVFEGTEPARFEVEVLGVMKDSGPGQSFILARLSGQGLEESGVIAGMSGSPVYIEDRLIGAVAFAWPFSKGAVGGITPIDSMLELRGVSGGVPLASPSSLPTLPGELLEADLKSDLLQREMARLGPSMPTDTRDGLVWSLSGFGPQSRDLIGAVLPAAAPTGEATADPESGLDPGDAVAGVLINGDLKLAVTGTVTERIEDEILAFGHAFLAQGPVSVPMARAEIITVLASEFISFKLANVGPVVGAFDLDRTSGVRGRLGAVVPTIPLSVSLEGLGTASYRMELAEVPVLLPVLTAISMLGTLDATTRSAGAQGLDVEVRWELDGHEPIELTQSFDGTASGFTAANYIFLMTNFLVNNPLEEARLRKVDVRLRQYDEPRTTRIIGGYANRSLARPGEQVTLTLELDPLRGDRYKREIEIELPDDLPAGRYSIMVGDGVTMDGVRQLVEQVAPEDFSQSLDIVRAFHSSRDLVVFGLTPGWGLSFSGRVLPQLPASMRELWRPVAPGSAVELGLAVVQEKEERTDVPLVGGVRIDVQIERPKPRRPNGNNGTHR